MWLVVVVVVGGGLSRGMITYVHCLSSEPVVSCWRRPCYEDAAGDRRTLFSFQPKTTKMGNSQQAQTQARSQYQYQARSGPRSEGCLRKRLLSASKVHQRPDSLWTPKPLLGPIFKGSSEATLTSKDGKGNRAESRGGAEFCRWWSAISQTVGASA